jgi:hypothetical protein
MKKQFMFLSMAVMAFAMVFAFVACGDDDKDDVDNGGGGNSSLSSRLVGSTWYVAWESANSVEVEGYSFKSDGTGTGYELKRKSSDDFTNTKSDVWDFKYSVSGNVITMVESNGGTENIRVSVNSDGSLNFQRGSENDTFYRLESNKTLNDLIAELSMKHQQGGEDNSSLSSSLVGSTWYVAWESDDLVEVEGYSFKSDGTGIGYELKRRSSDNFTNTKSDVWEFKYSISGNVITMVESNGGTESIQVSVNSDGSLNFQRGSENETFYRLESNKTIYDIIAELSMKHQQDGGNDKSNMVLKDFIIKPLGIVDVNLQTSSYYSIVDEVNKYFNISNSEWEGGRLFSLTVKKNPDCNNLYYKGSNFFELILSESDYTGTQLTRLCTYIFTSNLDDPLIIVEKMIDDFEEMGINMAVDLGNRIAKFIEKNEDGSLNKSYYISWKYNNDKNVWDINIEMWIEKFVY